MRKSMKFVTLLGISSVLLFGCTDNEKQPKSTDTVGSEKNITTVEQIFSMKDSDTILKLDGAEVKAKELKSTFSDDLVYISLYQVIKEKTFLKKYGPTEQEVEQRAKESNVTDALEIENLKTSMAYEKAAKSLYKPTDEDYQEIYEQFYDENVVKYEDAKETIEELAAVIKGEALVEEEKNKLLKATVIEFENKELEALYKKFNSPDDSAQ